MKILLTNDDGFQAPGIHALYEALSQVADVTVVAPDGERSAVSLAITLTDILRVKTIQNETMKGYTISGTPADCIKIGCSELLDFRPDYVFSGINSGSNTGLNANYSGTVAGAVEGAMLGIPAVAMSLASFKSKDFRGSCDAALKILELIKENPLGKYELLNVNVPPLPPEEIKGYKVTRVSFSSYREVFEKRVDARQNEYYWMGGVWTDLEKVNNGDLQANEEGYVSITPLTADWTAYSTLERLHDLGWEDSLNGGMK